uniref:Odorant receptor n=1 Tax=Lutzomyia longipalpis TaxID=7200 RepID=A0A240SXZ9_LUTLO
MSPQMEEFLKAKPRIDFSIALLTSNVVSGPPKNRFLVAFLAILNVFFTFCVYLHLKNSSWREINFNFLSSLLFFIILCGYAVRANVGRLKNTEMNHLVHNIKELFEEHEEDEELGQFLKKNLMNSMKIFHFCNRWGFRMFFVAGTFASFYFRLNEEFGLLYDLPFIASDNFLWKDALHVLQGVMYCVTSFGMISLDLGIIFLGLQVIAELNILSDCMKLLNEKIKTDQKFLSKIIKRHCSVIENLNLLSKIISETTSLQLLLTGVALLFGFTFLIKYTMGIGNYIIIICGGSLSLPICVLGEFIRLKTENLSETFYQTNWYELSLKDQKTFLIILGMAQREYGLKAAGMYDVNLYTFIQIFKIAFSYCAVLYSLSQ